MKWYLSVDPFNSDHLLTPPWSQLRQLLLRWLLLRQLLFDHCWDNHCWGNHCWDDCCWGDRCWDNHCWWWSSHVLILLGGSWSMIAVEMITVEVGTKLLLNNNGYCYTKLKNLNLNQIVNTSTRDSGTLIDHMYISSHLTCESTVANCYFSDHDFTFGVIQQLKH